jgi:aminoglycoside phosphotransferase family enzyme/predicted kinase
MVAAVGIETLHTRGRMLEDLVAELRRNARGAADAQDVHLVETHISWVLVGAEVFKIKKPVAFPFLDFSTFEKRERACRNEVRINRRLAPRVYLGVVSIRRRPDGRFTFEAGGPIVDWAVRMQRLDEEQRADRLLERGKLTGETIDHLASALAAFHADSPTGPRIIAMGAPGPIEQHARENFAALQDCEESLAPEVLGEIERWQLAFLRGQSARFEGRMKASAIRDGHGDLRLEHVFVRNGDFEILDGIEFDDRYRWGDVASDVAFLAMDLARLGRTDLAERFIAAYARAADDFDLYGVVDFYESYRACIRAKILAGSDPVAARRCLLLAHSARRRSLLPPMLVCIGGGIASGKSTVAELFADRASAPVVDADRTRKHLLGLEATSHGASAGAWKGAYTLEFSAKVYAEVLRRAGVVLASGRPVVIDASFRSAETRAAALALAEEHNVPFRFVECRVPLDVARARVAARDPATSVSDATPEVVDAFAAKFEPVTELPPTDHIILDTSGSREAATAGLLCELGGWPAGFGG